MNREEAKEVMKMYTTIMSSLDDFEHQKAEEWGADVERSSQSKLKLPLLIRVREAGGASGSAAAANAVAAVGGSAGGGALEPEVEGQLLQVNFDAALVRLLREVKYFLLLALEVPASALDIYKKAETFRRQTGACEVARCGTGRAAPRCSVFHHTPPPQATWTCW